MKIYYEGDQLVIDGENEQSTSVTLGNVDHVDVRNFVIEEPENS